MKIAVNTHLMIYGKLDGIGWFTYETISRITRSHPQHEFILIFDRKPDARLQFPSNTRIVVLPPPARHPLLWFLRFEIMLPLLLRKLKPDVFVSPDGWMSLNLPCPGLQVLHDINFAHKPGDLPFWVRNYYNKLFPRYARKATGIVTVSHFSRADIAATWDIDPNKIEVAHNGCSEDYQPLDEATRHHIRKQTTGGRPYFLYVGGLIPRKNIEKMLRAFDLFCQHDTGETQLVMVGPEKWGNAAMESTWKNMQYRHRVIFTGRLGTQELNKIYNASKALLFVPYFEGFGIPILEAFNAETAVICSNVTAMPEVAGDAALLTDPHNEQEIAEAMRRISTDDNLRAALIEKGRVRSRNFSWDKTAEKLWQAIEKAAGQKKKLQG